MIVIAMGYSGTGSSAIIHLLSEYDNCTECGLGKYEHLPFYTPHGLFDLEDCLLSNNSLYQSDAAINDFYSAMRRLNDNDFGWFGGYKKRYGNQFIQNVEEFIDELVQYRTDGFWSYDFKFKKNIFTIGRDCLKTILRKEVKDFGQKLLPYGDGKLIFSFVAPEQFYTAARKFVKRYFQMICPEKDKILLLDQIILPQNLYRINNYFDDDVKCIVFDRDARDVFIITNYIIPKMYNVASMFPTDAVEYSEFYRKFRNLERVTDNSNVLRLHFEDLIYKYDETVETIESFLQIDRNMHTRKKQVFNPEISIKNTQNFRIKKEWEEEARIIETYLPDLIYEFPYIINPKLEETSDP